MTERDVKFYGESGLIKFQWQWATGGARELAGANINLYDGKGSYLASAPLTLSEARELKNHLVEMLDG